jgi:mRNA interferase RelE/StbE
MVYKVIISKKTDKQLQKLSKVDIKRIIEKLRKLDYPFPPNFDIDKMTNEDNYFRLRVGTTRIVFEIDHAKREIWARRIQYRGQVYKN